MHMPYTVFVRQPNLGKHLNNADEFFSKHQTNLSYWELVSGLSGGLYSCDAQRNKQTNKQINK